MSEVRVLYRPQNNHLNAKHLGGFGFEAIEDLKDGAGATAAPAVDFIRLFEP